MRLLTLVGCLATVAVMTATATGNEVHSRVAGNADTVASHSAGKNAPSGADSAHHSPEPSDGAAHTYVEPAPPLNPNEEVLHIDVVRGGKVSFVLFTSLRRIDVVVISYFIVFPPDKSY
jgi:hypothetical protein